MNSLSIGPASLRAFLALLVIITFTSTGVNAQDNKEKPGHQKITIHIQKDVNGEKTEIDTTFEAENDFDVHAWIDDQDMDLRRVDDNMRSFEKQFNITIPEFRMKGDSLPHTIIINDDTIYINDYQKEMQALLQGMPELDRLRDLEIEKYFEEPLDLPDLHDCPRLKEYWEQCPRHRIESLPRIPRLPDLRIPELENLLPLGEIDHIVVKKKRNGKKIVIYFEDRDDENSCRRGKESTYYFDDETGRTPRHEERVIIKKDGDPVIIREKGENIERIKDGDKEIIIIRKKDH